MPLGLLDLINASRPSEASEENLLKCVFLPQVTVYYTCRRPVPAELNPAQLYRPPRKGIITGPGQRTRSPLCPRGPHCWLSVLAPSDRPPAWPLLCGDRSCSLSLGPRALPSTLQLFSRHAGDGAPWLSSEPLTSCRAMLACAHIRRKLLPVAFCMKAECTPWYPGTKPGLQHIGGP